MNPEMKSVSTENVNKLRENKMDNLEKIKWIKSQRKFYHNPKGSKES